ncbi:Sec-independent protein translocase protein TatB [Marilutibacter chinensis]|uniref:Sec-independent protein translocase protein TatB n=1 Tax=Marilutibacter chinensis TaxID=2912247 RepID=A0ABS9HUH6_9GAMM|nr:Sec-independent protein translocase protein TatB [Lysobacter chinensis]MCF7221752.1 Sec-independent protein translocase protein TatB [Lysobacter chinensis]
MFDIGFSEIFVIAVVALLVLGPERLPRAARFAGLWVRRARAQWYSVKSEFEREMADEELKRSLLDARDDLREAGQRLHDSGSTLKRELESLDPARRAAAADPAENLVDASDRSRRGEEERDVDPAPAGERPSTAGHDIRDDAGEPDAGPRDAGNSGTSTPAAGDGHAPRT